MSVVNTIAINFPSENPGSLHPVIPMGLSMPTWIFPICLSNEKRKRTPSCEGACESSEGQAGKLACITPVPILLTITWSHGPVSPPGGWRIYFSWKEWLSECIILRHREIKWDNVEVPWHRVWLTKEAFSKYWLPAEKAFHGLIDVNKFLNNFCYISTWLNQIDY